MKFILLVTAVLALTVQASVFSQSSRISINSKGQTIREIMQQIEQKSAYRFFYNDQLVHLDDRVDFRVKNVSEFEAIEQLFEGQKLTFQLMEDSLVLIMPAALVQQHNVTGTVADENGEPLPGVTVRIKGTNKGTVTNLEGNFSIEVEDPETAVLQFSYVGYVSQDVSVDNRTEMSIRLYLDTEELEEVVVVGYGSLKKVNLSGAVVAVETEQLESRPITNVSQGLQGAVAGLNIDFMSGEPGSSAKINIRGLTSINGGEPLILIDGVPSESQELNRIPPSDVESISVLKDASSAAIYGARAAFGVVLITTKQGKSEGLTVNYSNNFAWQKPTILPEKVTDPYIYIKLRALSTANTPWPMYQPTDEEVLWARQRSDSAFFYTEGVRESTQNPGLWEYMGNRDWTDLFLADYSSTMQHHLSVNGKSEKATYYLSAGYDTENGALKIADDKFDRYSVRSNVSYKLTDWLKIGNNSLMQNTNRFRPYWLSMKPLYDMRPSDGWDFNPDDTWSNTKVGREASALQNGGIYSYDVTALQTTFTGEASFFENALRVNGDVTIKRTVNNRISNQLKWPVGYGPGDVREEYTNEAGRSFSYESYKAYNLYATFDKIFDKHHLMAITGFNQEYYKYEYVSLEREGVISASVPSIQLATGEMSMSEYIADWAIRGAFYRLNYIYDDRFILEFNGRYDGSSRFPKDSRFGFFPTASAAWRMDNESFMSGINHIISTLKPRVSYGTLGNQFVSNYGYMPTMSAWERSIMIGGSRPMATSSPGLVSSNYSWENVTSANIGLDLGFMENRLLATLDVYRRDTKGMLTQGKDLPDVLGTYEPSENAADLRTEGWEASISYKMSSRIAGKPLAVNTSFILSDNQSTITRFDNPTGDLDQYYVGRELGEIWGLTSDGLFQSEEEIAELDESAIIPWGELDIVPGWPKYVDQDGDGRIEKGLTLDDPKDLSIIGNMTPRYRYSFNMEANWNGFDLRVFLQGIFKKDFYPQGHLYWGLHMSPYYNMYEHNLDFYRPESDSEEERAGHSQAYLDAGLADANLDAEYPILQAWLADWHLGERVNNAMGLAIPQTAYLLNAGYLRVKNVTLGYTLSGRLSQRIGIERLRLYVSGENLFEWSEVKRYYDPESITDNFFIDPTAYRRDGETKGYTYPFQRRYSFGVEITF